MPVGDAMGHHYSGLFFLFWVVVTTMAAMMLALRRSCADVSLGKNKVCFPDSGQVEDLRDKKDTPPVKRVKSSHVKSVVSPPPLLICHLGLGMISMPPYLSFLSPLSSPLCVKIPVLPENLLPSPPSPFLNVSPPPATDPTYQLHVLPTSPWMAVRSCIRMYIRL